MGTQAPSRQRGVPVDPNLSRDPAEVVAESGPVMAIIDELIAEYDAQVGGYEETYTVRVAVDIPCSECRSTGLKGAASSEVCPACEGNRTVPKRYDFTFRAPQNLEDVDEFQKAAAEKLIKWIDPERRWPPAFKDALEGLSRRDLVAAFTMSYWSADRNAMNDLAALKLCHRPALADMVIQAINKRFSAGYTVSAMAAVEAQKKG